MKVRKTPDDKFEIIEEIHSKLHELVEVYTETHSKVLEVRFDLTYPIGHTPRPGNEDISLTMSKVNQTFERKNLSPGFGWVREQKTSKNQHYHGMILLDGQKTQSPEMVWNIVEKNWQRTIGSEKGGLIDKCKGPKNRPHENGKVYQRRDGIPDYVERQINYMAKAEDKAEPKDGMRNFGTSRLDKFRKG